MQLLQCLGACGCALPLLLLLLVAAGCAAAIAAAATAAVGETSWKHVACLKAGADATRRI
jgi:hypothetical protein